MARFHLLLGIASSAAVATNEEEEEEEDWQDTERSSSVCRRPQLSIMAAMAAALRRSLVICGSVEALDDGDQHSDAGPWPRYPPLPPSSSSSSSSCSFLSSAMEIGRPTDVQHLTHVTFDQFDGFLGLPMELQPDVPRRSPSASTSVFGVSAVSLQCSYDSRGNAVPAILLAMQRQLYLRGGLQLEGIFRINAENGQELLVRDQLNGGFVPNEIDLHCLAGLIKAWFRELPNGVLDSLTSDQMSHCNTEEECSELARMLPPTEAALLDWCIDLMADVVEHEHCNKMNARNIAMVFAPNMTQMADPLTALVHAVQVMNFLKTLIMKTLREREEAITAAKMCSPCSEPPSDHDESKSMKTVEKYTTCINDKRSNLQAFDKIALDLLFNAEKPQESDVGGGFCSLHNKCNGDSESKIVHGNREGASDKLNFRKGVMKLYRHPAFQLIRPSQKLADLVLVDSREGGREACA